MYRYTGGSVRQKIPKPNELSKTSLAVGTFDRPRKTTSTEAFVYVPPKKKPAKQTKNRTKKTQKSVAKTITKKRSERAIPKSVPKIKPSNKKPKSTDPVLPSNNVTPLLEITKNPPTESTKIAHDSTLEIIDLNSQSYEQNANETMSSYLSRLQAIFAQQKSAEVHYLCFFKNIRSIVYDIDATNLDDLDLAKLDRMKDLLYAAELKLKVVYGNSRSRCD